MPDSARNPATHPWLAVADRLAALDNLLLSLQQEAARLHEDRPVVATRIEALVDKLFAERDAILEQVDDLSGLTEYYHQLAKERRPPA